MRAWISLTAGDYHGVVAACRAGTDVTPHHSVAVQLFAQEAKAWACLADQDQRPSWSLRSRRRHLTDSPMGEYGCPWFG